MTVPTNGAERLRGYLREHKREGATWKTLGSTLRGYITGGIPERPIDRTFARIDRLLKWEMGSAQRVFEGGEPSPLPVDPDANGADSQLMLAEEELKKALQSIGNALEAVRQATPLSHRSAARLREGPTRREESA